MELVLMLRQLLVNYANLDGVPLKFVPKALLTRNFWKYEKNKVSLHSEKMQSKKINVILYI